MPQVNLGSVYAKLEFDIREAQTNIDKIQGSFKQLGKAVETSAVATEKSWKDNLAGIGTSLTSFGKSATIALTLPLVLFGKKAIDTAVDYDKTMNIIKVASGQGQAAIDLLTPTIEEFGTKGKFSLIGVANAVKDMVKDGLTPAEIATGQLEAAFNMATATGEDLYQSQRVLSNAMASYGVDVQEAAHFSDVLTGALNSSQLELEDLAGSIAYIAPIASTLGMSIDDLGATIAQLGDIGIKGSMAGTTLRRSMISLVAPTSRGRKAMDELGVSAFDSSGKMKNWKTIIGDFNKALFESGETTAIVSGRTKEQDDELDRLGKKYQAANQKIDDYRDGTTGVNLSDDARNDKIKEQEKLMDNIGGKMQELNGIQGKSIKIIKKLTNKQKSKYLSDVFGVYAVVGMTALISQGTEGFEKYKAQVSEVDKAQKQAKEASAGFAFQVQRLNSQVFLFMSKIGKEFQPVIEKIADGMSRLNKMWEGLDPNVRKAAVAFGAFLVAIGPVALILGNIATMVSGNGAMATGFALMKTSISGLLTGVSFGPFLLVFGLVAGAVLLIVKNLDVLKNILDTNIKPALQGFIDFAQPIIKSFKPVFDALIEAFKFIWEVMRDSLQPAFDNFGKLLKEQVAPIFERIMTAIQPLVPFLLALVAGVGIVLFGAFTILMALISGAINALGPFITGILKIIGGVVEIVTGLFAVISGLIEGLITGDFTRLKEGWETLWNGIKDFLGGIVTVILGTIKGFIEGIINFFVSLADKLVGHSIIPDMVNSIIGWITTLVSKVIGIITGFVTNFINAWTSILTRLGTWWASLINLLAEWKTKLFEWGGNLAKSFVDGFGKIGELLKNKLKSAFDSAKEWLKGNSPPVSGPLKDIDKWGFNVGMAWADGFTSAFSNLTSAIPVGGMSVVGGLASGLGGSVSTPSSQTFNVYVGMYAGSPMEKRQIAKELNDALNDYKKGTGI